MAFAEPQHEISARRIWRLVAGLLGLAGIAGPLGCRPPGSDPEVVVYTALDREFSEPIFEDFTRLTGISVRAKYDTEANKTVGLANLILNERARPRCDLFWNNEILHTLRLQRAGLLRAHASRWADQYPPQYRSSEGYWYGFAARARVLLINRDKLPADRWPQGLRDLADPRWRGQVGLAKPLFGTTATHAACLFAAWGPKAAEEFFRELKRNATVFPGNRQVAQAVGAGQIAVGLTDTDDAVIEVEQGRPVTIVYPDQTQDGLGTLFIPNTLSLVAGGPHPEAARQLLEYLLSPTTEQRLAEGPSAQIPLNLQGQATQRVQTPRTVRGMPIDFPAAADRWEEAAKFFREEY